MLYIITKTLCLSAVARMLASTYEFHQINDWNFAVLAFSAFNAGLVADQGPQFVQSDGWAELVVAVQVEIAHTQFTEITGMVFVEVDAMMVHTTSITATSRMLSVLACFALSQSDGIPC